MEAYSPSACSVRGGEELVLTGSNFLPDSKVVFIERGPGEYALGRAGRAGRGRWGRQAKGLGAAAGPASL